AWRRLRRHCEEPRRGDEAIQALPCRRRGARSLWHRRFWIASPSLTLGLAMTRESALGRAMTEENALGRALTGKVRGPAMTSRWCARHDGSLSPNPALADRGAAVDRQLLAGRDRRFVGGKIDRHLRHVPRQAETQEM